MASAVAETMADMPAESFDAGSTAPRFIAQKETKKTFVLFVTFCAKGAGSCFQTAHLLLKAGGQLSGPPIGFAGWERADSNRAEHAYQPIASPQGN
jgi:hypothetical protein